MQEVKQYRSGQANMQHTGFFAEGVRGGSLGLGNRYLPSNSKYRLDIPRWSYLDTKQWTPKEAWLLRYRGGSRASCYNVNIVSSSLRSVQQASKFEISATSRQV